MLSDKERRQRYVDLINHLREQLLYGGEWKPFSSDYITNIYKVKGGTLSTLVDLGALTRKRDTSPGGGPKTVYKSNVDLFAPSIYQRLFDQMHPPKPAGNEPTPVAEKLGISPDTIAETKEGTGTILLIDPEGKLAMQRYDTIDEATNFVKANGTPSQLWMVVTPVAIIKTELTVETTNTNIV